MRKRSVVMVTVSARDLKNAFRKAHPEVQTAQELYPVWLQFWSRLVLTAKVEKILPPSGSTESEPIFKEMENYDEAADRAKELDSEKDDV